MHQRICCFWGVRQEKLIGLRRGQLTPKVSSTYSGEKVGRTMFNYRLAFKCSLHGARDYDGAIAVEVAAVFRNSQRLTSLCISTSEGLASGTQA